MESPNMDSIIHQWRELGVSEPELIRALRTYNGYAPDWRTASDELEESLP